MHYVMSPEQEPVKRVLGNFHGHRLKGPKRRRVQLNDEVIEIPLLESLEQWLNNPSILKQVNRNYGEVILHFAVLVLSLGELSFMWTSSQLVGICLVGNFHNFAHWYS